MIFSFIYYYYYWQGNAHWSDLLCVALDLQLQKSLLGAFCQPGLPKFCCGCSNSSCKATEGIYVYFHGA